jgi:hypothetical protein
MPIYSIRTLAAFATFATFASAGLCMAATVTTAGAAGSANGAALTREAAKSIVDSVDINAGGADGQLLSQDVLKKLSGTQRKNIQWALQDIYGDDPIYLLAYQQTAAPLSDNIVGPITLSWLNRFWFDFKMEPASNLTDASVAALLHFADIVRKHPEWKKDLLSTGLAGWIDGKEAADKARYYHIRLAGTDPQIAAMLKLYHDQTSNGAGADVDQDQALLTIYSYTLTQADFDLLRGKTKIVQQLSALQDITYLNRPLFDTAVTDALKDLKGQADANLPAIEHAAEEKHYLPAKAIQMLTAGKDVPDEVLAAMEPMAGDDYITEAAFTTAIDKAVDDAGLKTPVKPYLPALIKASQATMYTLNAAALDGLRLNRIDAQVPDVILDMLQEMQGLEYPQRWLFDKAALALLRNGFGGCTSGIPADMADLRKVPLETIQKLKGSIDPVLYASLEKIWQDGACTDPGQVAAMNQQIQKLYELYRPSLRKIARKKPLYDPDKRVLWDGDSCGCALDQFKGEVYGFYPFWHAGEKQRIDFSTLSRIGYYGITFDDHGSLQQANDGRSIDASLLNGDPTQNDFVNVARKYRTAIDWVIQRNDWRSWATMGQVEKEAVFVQLNVGITHLLTAKMQGGATSELKHLPFGLGERAIPTNGDGVTLFFDNYPTDNISVALFNAFIEKLKSSLRSQGAGDTVNILMRHSAMGQGIYDYKNLLLLIDASKASTPKTIHIRAEIGNAALPRFLVLLEEPTTDTKKKLRLEIESARDLYGIARVEVLRQIFPVITFGAKDWQQLEDDIVYYKDNFGGIGFWPLSAVPAAQKPPVVLPAGVLDCITSKDVSRCLIDHYQIKPGVQTGAVCKTVCENRLAFRTGTALFVFLLLTCWGLYWWSCRWRAWMSAYYFAPIIATGAVTMFLVLSLLFCDPFFLWLSQGYLIPIFMFAVIVIMFFVCRNLLRARDEQP